MELGKEQMKETEILKINADWTEVKNECRHTMNKDDTYTKATDEFVENVLISEHSPIRLIKIKWRWASIKSWVSVHFARHWLGWDKFVSTQRTDRTGTDRDSARQDTPVNMDIEANPQALINVSRFRLCYQASSETREKMEDLKRAIKESGQEKIAYVMQKNCIYRCGCPEFKECGYWKGFCERHKDENLLDIRTRYRLADEEFYDTRRN